MVFNFTGVFFPAGTYFCESSTIQKSTNIKPCKIKVLLVLCPHNKQTVNVPTTNVTNKRLILVKYNNYHAIKEKSATENRQNLSP